MFLSRKILKRIYVYIAYINKLERILENLYILIIQQQI